MSLWPFVGSIFWVFLAFQSPFVKLQRLRPDFVFIAHPKNQADYQRLDKLLTPLERLQFHIGDSLKVFHWTSDKRPESGWPFVYANVIPAYLKILQSPG